MTDLAKLTFEDFAALAGQTFTVDFDDVGRIELEVIGASPHAANAPAVDSTGTRSPFSVEFRGPVDPVLPQRTYVIAHEAVGAIAVFLGPIGRDDAGTRYDAVFA
jgi:hypothetical protein